MIVTILVILFIPVAMLMCVNPGKMQHVNFQDILQENTVKSAVQQINTGGQSDIEREEIHEAVHPNAVQEMNFPKTIDIQSQIESSGEVKITFHFFRQSIIASNQFAVWIEDQHGKIIKTLFVTRFTGEGGYTFRKNTIPIWVKKAEPAGMNDADIDAITGATPQAGILTYVWDCTDRLGQPVPAGEYRFFVEGTLYWEDDVLFSGTIYIGGEDMSVQATPIYSSENTTYRNMVQNVSASFIKR